MIKQKITYHDNFEIKTIEEFDEHDVLVEITIFDDQANILYRENKEKVYIFEYLDNDIKLYYLEDRIKDTWERSFYDQDDNKLFGERSDGVWFESRYNENGKKVFFLNSHGSIHDYSGPMVRYIDCKEPEKMCSHKITGEKTKNNFGYFIK